jgi:hypothetical protein
MSLREMFGCWGCRKPGGTDEPHRDFDLRPFGIGFVHERCRVPGDGLDSRPLCTMGDDGHYRDGPLARVDQLESGAA